MCWISVLLWILSSITIVAGPCFPGVLNISAYPRNEWLSLSPTKDGLFLSFPGMKFRCASNITGMALWTAQQPNVNWSQNLSLTLFVNSNAQESITLSTTEGSLPAVINVTLKTTVSVQTGSELQFLFPKPRLGMHWYLPVAFVRSDDPVTTIMPTVEKDSANCSIFGGSVEGGRNCRVQPLMQIYFIPGEWTFVYRTSYQYLDPQQHAWPTLLKLVSNWEQW